jgi:hypothetical protein
VADLVAAAGERLRERRCERRRNDRRLRAAVREHVRVVVHRQQRVDGDRNDAGVDRAEERDRPGVAVEHEEQHALLAADAEADERRGEAPGALVELAVREAAAVVGVGELGGAAAVGVEQVAGEVERFGRRRHRGRRLAGGRAR